MKKKKIIINARELNKFQESLFEIRTEVINAVLFFPIILISFIQLVKLRENQMDNSIVGMALTMIATASIIYFYYRFIRDKVFISNKTYYSPRFKGMQEDLNSSWIINRQMVEEMLTANWYDNSNSKTDILKNCYGHSVFENLKTQAFEDVREMVSYIEQPKPYMINKVLNYKDISEGKYLFKKPFTFEKQNISDLQAYYAFTIGLKSADEFAWKAIRLKSKEQLVDFLDDKLVEDA